MDYICKLIILRNLTVCEEYKFYVLFGRAFKDANNYIKVSIHVLLAVTVG